MLQSRVAICPACERASTAGSLFNLQATLDKVDAMSTDSIDRTVPSVSVVIPVYRDLQATQACLRSVIDSGLPDDTTITIIDDMSPEEEVSEYCQEVAGKFGFKLISNEENLGFVRTANKGFTLCPEADIILLNSDTIVPHGWVQRLQACAYREPDVGTVTPFSNNGTICSYPVFPLANELPREWPTAELDRLFQSANAGLYAEIPTAVGFCMFIKRSCLNQTGPFNEEKFGQGYGEECDFSLRASPLGWKHVIAADVFVYHEGGASFASESSERKRKADRVMNELHPKYHDTVSDFVQTDPLSDLRMRVDVARIAAKPADSSAVLEEHFRYSQSVLKRVAEAQHAIIKEQEQRLQLEELLDRCRSEFLETDRALIEAQKMLLESRQYADQLMDHIKDMEQSRSWRYTQWMRRNQ
jgi:GT2 family glycosyltransferase